MKCPECGAELPADSEFCAECGSTALESSFDSVDLADEDSTGSGVAPLRPDWPDQTEVPPPPTDRFEVIEEVGRGAFGIVWKCRRKKQGLSGADDVVAVKRLVASGAPIEEGIRRFIREVAAIQKLRHQSIVSLLDYDQDFYGPYLVMEYVEGRTLANVLQQKGPLSVEEATRIGVELCHALHHAHTRPERVVHRDVKPGNVIIAHPDGVPRLVDFGLARESSESQDRSYGYTAGTWEYASPEQRMGRPVGLHTDIFSLGATLYHLVTMSSPGLRIVEARIPEKMRHVIMKATDEEPEERFASIDLMRLAMAGASSEPTMGTTGVTIAADDPDLCPICHGHRIENHRFCPDTGEPLYKVCPACKHDDNPLRVKFCVRCGCNLTRVQEAIDAIRFGDERMREKNLDHAKMEYEKAISLLKDQSSAREIYTATVEKRNRVRNLIDEREKVRGAVESLLGTAEFAEAERILSNAAEKDPECSTYQDYLDRIPRMRRRHLLQQARKHSEEWDLETSFQLAQKAAAISAPGGREAERFLAQIRRKRTDFRELEKQVARLLKDTRYTEVIDLCDAAGAEFPRHPRLDAWTRKAKGCIDEYADLLQNGNDAIGRKDWAQAESYFEEARQACPADDTRALEGIKRARMGRFEALLQEAEAELDKGRWQQAQKWCARARELAPRSPRIAEIMLKAKKRRNRTRRRWAALVVLLLLLAAAVVGSGPATVWLANTDRIEIADQVKNVLGWATISPSSVDAAYSEYHTRRARKIAEDGRPEEAIEAFSRARESATEEQIPALETEMLAVVRAVADRAGESGDPASRVLWLLKVKGLSGPEAEGAEVLDGQIEEATESVREEMARAIRLSDEESEKAKCISTKQEELDLRWTITDPEKVKVDRAELFDGVDVKAANPLADSITCRYRFSIANATKKLVLRATRQITPDVSITVEKELIALWDDTKPTVRLADPDGKGGVTTKDREFDVIVFVDDASREWGFPIRSVHAEGKWLERGEVKTTGEGQYAIPVKLRPDRLEDALTVTVEDWAGHTTAVEIPITFDEQIRIEDFRPVGIDETAGGEYLTGRDTVRVRVKTLEPQLDFGPAAETRIRIEPEGREPITVRFAKTHLKRAGNTSLLEMDVTLPPGLCRVTATIEDEARNTDKASFLVFVDQEAPRIERDCVRATAVECLEIHDGIPHLLVTKDRKVTVEISDKALGEVKLDGEVVNLESGQPLELSPRTGLNTFRIEARDRMGNVAGPVELRFVYHRLPRGLEVREQRIFGRIGDVESEMLYVPAGTVKLTGAPNPVSLDAFLIETREARGKDDKPLTKLTIREAETRADSWGKRLPREEEWVRALQALPADRLLAMRDGVSEWVRASSDATVKADRAKNFGELDTVARGGSTKEHTEARLWRAGTESDAIGFRCVMDLR